MRRAAGKTVLHRAQEYGVEASRLMVRIARDTGCTWFGNSAHFLDLWVVYPSKQLTSTKARARNGSKKISLEMLLMEAAIS